MKWTTGLELPVIDGSRQIMISRFGFERQGSLSFQLTVPEIKKWTNGLDLFEIDGHYSSWALDVKNPSPLTSSQLHLIQHLAGFRHFSSRDLHRPLRSSRSPFPNLRSVKACASPSDQTVYGIFHRDPTLDGLLPPEILLTSDLEDFLGLKRLSLRSF